VHSSALAVPFSELPPTPRLRKRSFLISITVHATIIFLVVVLHQSGANNIDLAREDLRSHAIQLYLPPLAKAHTPEDRFLLPLDRASKEEFRADTAESRTPAPVAAKVIANEFEAVAKTIQLHVGKVEVGALDRTSKTAGPTLGYDGLGEVVIGGLNGGSAASRQSEPVGAGRPTDVFTQSGPARMQAALPVQPKGDEPAQLLSAPTPLYTEEARRLNVSGEVVLAVKLSTAGDVHVLRVVSGLGHGLDEAAIAAVKQTRCRPAFKEGRPVDVITTITVVFKLT
jgi:TonB family protein